jgi:hypothetical protein
VCLELALAVRSEPRKRFGDEQATNNNKDYLGDTINYFQSESGTGACTATGWVVLVRVCPLSITFVAWRHVASKKIAVRSQLLLNCRCR